MSQPRHKKLFLFLAAFALVGGLAFATGNAALAQSDPALGLEYAEGISILGTTDIRVTIFRIINIVLGLVGILFLGYVIYGGYLYMMSAGDPNKQIDAKRTLRNAVIGLVIVLSALAIAQFILYKIGEATGALEACSPPAAIETCFIGGCEGTRTCSAAGYWTSCNLFPGCDPDAVPRFYVRSTSPFEGAKNVIRNVVPQVTFNQNVDPLTLSDSMGDPTIIIEDSLGALVTGTLSISPSSGRSVRFKIDKPSNPCLTDEGDQIYDEMGDPVEGCLAPNEEFKIIAINGSDGVRSVDGDELNCGFTSCEFTFETGSFVDVRSPRIDLSNPAKVCVGDTTQVRAIIVDDFGLADTLMEAVDTDTGTLYDFVYHTDPVTELKCSGDPGSADGVTCKPRFTWDTTGLDPLALHDATINVVAQDFDDHASSESLQMFVRPEYCCNGVWDEAEGETAIDCGGLCGLCAGANCNVSTEEGICDPQDSLCSTNICDNGSCLCLQPPVIDAITPMDGSNPAADEGGLITIWGRNFGRTPGRIVFHGSDPLPVDNLDGVDPATLNPECTDTWTDTQIIIGVPVGAVTDGPIEVITDAGLADRTDDLYGNFVPNLLIHPNYTAPGICKLSPPEGEFEDIFNVYGIKMNGSGIGPTIAAGHAVRFGAGATAQLDSAATWTDLEITGAIVPNVEQGRHTVTVRDNATRSNSLEFHVGESSQLPYIASVNPDNGGKSQYVTISGDRFGSRPGVVTFHDAGLNRDAFGRSDFPPICQDSWWGNNQIVVKVPAKYQGGAAIGQFVHQLRITTATGLESNEVDFDITSALPGPGLCLMIPENGIEGTFVDLYGEFFAPHGPGEKVVYSPNLNHEGYVSWKYDTEKLADRVRGSKVPAGVVSGPTIVTKDTGIAIATQAPCETAGYYWNATTSTCMFPSNPLDFSVGLCTEGDVCSDSTSCCMSGIYEGQCIVPSVIDCDEGYASCSYSWSFSTYREDVCDTVDCLNPPQVEKDPLCDNGSFSSPTPPVNSISVCTNAAASVRFNQKIKHSTLVSAADAKVHPNVVLRECGNGGSPVCAGTLSAVVRVNETADDKTFLVLYPDAELWPGYWYDITLQDGITSPTGVPLDGNFDDIPGGNYDVWTFRVEDHRCQADSIILEPEFALLNQKNDAEDFLAAAMDDQCFLISDLEYGWIIDNPEICSIDEATVLPVNEAVARNEGVTFIEASVEAEDPETGEVVDILADRSPITVRFVDLYVKDYWPDCSAACRNASIGAEMSLDLRGLLEGNVTYSYSTDLTGAGDTLALYKCLDAECLYPNMERLNLVDSASTLPGAVQYIGVPSYYALNISPSEIYDTTGALYNGGTLERNTHYRVYLGKDIRAWNGQKLSRLNFSFGSGEECDPQSEPWKTEGGCDPATCQIDTSIGPDNCGDGTLDYNEECDDGNLIDGDGCNLDCNLEGSRFDFQCGDGEEASADTDKADILWEYYTQSGTAHLDPGEDCDPQAEPWKTNGGCLSTCKLEGSDPFSAVDPICGDGVVQYGEQCDPDIAPWAGSGGCDPNTCLLTGTGATCGNGSIDAGEACDPGMGPWDANGGCTSSCLNAGTPNARCGNSTVETGEACDDGNTSNGDGCDATCLAEGPVGLATCGDGIVSGSDLDGFSWVFKVGDSPSACQIDRISVLPEKHTSYYIGDVYGTVTLPYSQPDECSPRGQMLDPFDPSYNWTWDPAPGLQLQAAYPGRLGAAIDEDVANITTADHIPGNASQAMTTIGEALLDDAARQETVVAAREETSNVVCIDERSSCADMTLQCGFTSDDECQNACDTATLTCTTNPLIDCSAHGDADCVGVARNTCCQVRPWVETCSPTAVVDTCTPGATNQCRNISIEIAFGQELDTSSIQGNVTVEKISAGCGLARADESLLGRAIAFVKGLFGLNTARAANCFVTGTTSFYENDLGTTTAVFNPSEYLDALSEYRVTVFGDDLDTETKSGVRNKNGVTMNGDHEWTFETGSDICDVDFVEVTVVRMDSLGEPMGAITDRDLFQCAGDSCTEDYSATFAATQHYYHAMARDITGVALAQIEYEWTFSSNPKNLLKFQDPLEGAPTRLDEWITGVADQRDTYVMLNKAEQDSKGIVRVDAIGDPEVGSAVQKVDVRVFLCSNPWPRVEHFPYVDEENNCTVYGDGHSCGDYNFEMYYCRDAGNPDLLSDDLPELIYGIAQTGLPLSADPLVSTCDLAEYPDGCAVVTASEADPAPPADEEYQRQLKEFLFLDAGGAANAIGLRVYENQQGYSPERWYKNNVPNPGAPSAAKVDGYEATVDGRTVYVGATNKVGTTDIYSNIYLLSHNQGGGQEIKDIYGQLKRYIKFNANMENLGVCLSSGVSVAEEPQWHWNNDGDYDDVISTPLTAHLNPSASGDAPQVIVNSYDELGYCGSKCDGRLRVLDGANGSEMTSSALYRFDYDDPMIYPNPRSEMAVGNLDVDPELEIVFRGSDYCLNAELGDPMFCSLNPSVPCVTGTCTSGKVIALNHDGSTLWKTNPPANVVNRFSIYDSDQDGMGEVFSRRVRIDGQTGEVLTDQPGYGMFSMIADIDDDGDNEAIVGGQILTADMSASDGYTTAAIWANGNSAVGDVDADGEAEVVIHRSDSHVGILEWNGAVGSVSSIGGPFDTGSVPPVLANLDADEELEIIITTTNFLQALDTDGTPLWNHSIFMPSSVGATAFDFNNDGRSEILIHDSGYFWVLGPQGDIIFEIVNNQDTLSEQSYVVDVDGDGQAEIVVPSSNGDTRGVRVFETGSTRWPATREIWNQHSYYAANVCDGTEGIAQCNYGDAMSVPVRPWENGFSSLSQPVTDGSTGLIQCTKDIDCGDGGICQADKSKLIRDTRRLADVREMQRLADSYKEIYGEYPKVESGSYVVGTSFSAWPSWTQTMPGSLGSLPKDPINRFYGCEDPYNPKTCWDETALTFACPAEAHVYSYQSQADGAVAKFYANFEYALGYGGSFDAGTVAQCNDGSDNDGDGLVDLADPGCFSAADDTEDDAAPDMGEGLCLNYYGTVAGDKDNDNVADEVDNCPDDANGGQADADGDGLGDVCDPCPADSPNDIDNDKFCKTTGQLTYGSNDNCYNIYNPDQTDTDIDGIGDACDTTYTAGPSSPCTGDADADGYCDEQDNCPAVYNPGQADGDLNGVGDACDYCDVYPDDDNDGLCGLDTFVPLSCPPNYDDYLQYTVAPNPPSYYAELFDGDTATFTIPACQDIYAMSTDLYYDSSGLAQERYVTLSIDVSGSMGPLGGGGAIDAIISALGTGGTIIDDLFAKGNMHVKVITWNTAVVMETPFYDETQAGLLKAAVDAIAVGSGTTLNVGAKVAVDSFAGHASPGDSKTVVYLTDAGSAPLGEVTLSYGHSQMGKIDGQEIYTILYSTGPLLEEFMCEMSGFWPSTAVYDHTDNNCTSSYSGNYYNIAGAGTIAAVLDSIVAGIPTFTGSSMEMDLGGGIIYSTDLSTFVPGVPMTYDFDIAGPPVLSGLVCDGVPHTLDLNMNISASDAMRVNNLKLNYCPAATIDSFLGDDNCPNVYNPSQADSDGDTIGDACDECHDPDSDLFGEEGYALADCIGSVTVPDNCPATPNMDQRDRDQDGLGDACDGQTCGNGILESGEICDPDPLDPGCGTFCDWQEQIDGTYLCVVTVGDACADGETSSQRQYVCNDQCEYEGGWCGDGTVQPGLETCEFGGQGLAIDDQYSCSGACQWMGGWCGDGVVNSLYGEECDGPIIGGGTEYDNPYGCTADCKFDYDSGWCGDGVVQAAFEVCDGPGSGTSATDTYECAIDCSAWVGGYCGDDIIDHAFDEYCDAGLPWASPPTTEAYDLNYAAEEGPLARLPGSDSDHQWECYEDCTQTGGWCGDGIVQTNLIPFTTTPYEECDVPTGVEDIHLVFTVDTSGSMDSEWSSLCNAIFRIEPYIDALDVDLTIETFSQGACRGTCCDRNLVADPFGLTPPSTNNGEDLCPATGDISRRDSGSATEYVSERSDRLGQPMSSKWVPDSLKIIVPISDEAPNNGDYWSDPGAGDDVICSNGSNGGFDYAAANDVIVYPLYAEADPGRLGNLLTASGAEGEVITYNGTTAMTDEEMVCHIKKIIAKALCDADLDGAMDCREMFTGC